MCYGCWEEAGKPEIATLEVAQLAMNMQKADEYGALHIFVEDWNCADDSVQFCHDHEEATEWEKRLCNQALAVDESARISALALACNFWGAQSIAERKER